MEWLKSSKKSNYSNRISFRDDILDAFVARPTLNKKQKLTKPNHQAKPWKHIEKNENQKRFEQIHFEDVTRVASYDNRINYKYSNSTSSLCVYEGFDPRVVNDVKFQEIITVDDVGGKANSLVRGMHTVKCS